MRPALAALAVLTFANLAPAGDWPQWLGPKRDGSSPEVVKPWTGDPQVLWRVPVGDGHSSPIVAQGKVYLHSRVPGRDEEQLQQFDAATGKPGGFTAVHKRAAFTTPFGTGPRATPLVTPEGAVVSLGATGVLAYDVPAPSAGNAKSWNTNVLEQFKAPNLRFGLSASPLFEADLILVAVGGKGAGVVAYKPSGEVAWKALNDLASYASPVAFDAGGQRQVVFLTAEAVESLDPKTGEPHWRYPFRDLLSESSTTPVKMGDLLIVSSVTLGSAGLKLTTKDGKPAAEQVWKNPQLSCYFSTPVPVGDKYVFMVTGSLEAVMSSKPEATLQCVEAATGKSLWSRPKVGKYHAALTRTGDGKVLMLEDTGDLVLINPDPAAYKELARSKVCGQTWAHPALAGGRLYLRDDKELICLQLPE
jgi:outer membrane protein assembly factor BamB